jgi:hypothetical protein
VIPICSISGFNTGVALKAPGVGFQHQFTSNWLTILVVGSQEPEPPEE